MGLAVVFYVAPGDEEVEIMCFPEAASLEEASSMLTSDCKVIGGRWLDSRGYEKEEKVHKGLCELGGGEFRHLTEHWLKQAFQNSMPKSANP